MFDTKDGLWDLIEIVRKSIDKQAISVPFYRNKDSSITKVSQKVLLKKGLIIRDRRK